MLTAIINQELCVGCGLCLQACPFDAIIGTPGKMHVVLAQECIGCTLCVNPCPVDCIQLSPVSETNALQRPEILKKAKFRKQAKINRNKLNSIELLDQREIIKDLAEINLD